jgi:hypothetical protein
MTYDKVILDGYTLEIQPTNYDDNYFDSREYKRAVDGTLNQFPGITKREVSFSGLTEESQLSTIEGKYLNGSAVSFTDPRGNVFNVYITHLEKRYSDKVRAQYTIELKEV